MHVFKDAFVSDDRQFGFKSGVGCSEAIFSCKFTIDHFVQRGKSVLLPLLISAKPFIELTIVNYLRPCMIHIFHALY